MRRWSRKLQYAAVVIAVLALVYWLWSRPATSAFGLRGFGTRTSQTYGYTQAGPAPPVFGGSLGPPTYEKFLSPSQVREEVRTSF